MSKADQIREARERLNMTQETLAEQVGVSRQAVSKWEMGVSEPSLENLKALSQVLEMDLGQMPVVEEKARNPWKISSLAMGFLFLVSLVVLGITLSGNAVEVSAAEAAQVDPSVTGTAFFDTDGNSLRPNLGDGWLYFTPGSQVFMAVSYQDGMDTFVHAVSLFLTPTGTETFNEREQLAVQAVEQNRGIALFLLDIPLDLMGHLDITLECDGGQHVTEELNVTSLR